MQWDNKLNAGFSDSENGTWLDIAPDYSTVNVAVRWFRLLTRKRVLKTGKPSNPAHIVLSRFSRLMHTPPCHSIVLWVCSEGLSWPCPEAGSASSEWCQRICLSAWAGWAQQSLPGGSKLGKDTTTDLSSVSELPGHSYCAFKYSVISQKTLSKSRIPTSQGQGLLLEYSPISAFTPIMHPSAMFLRKPATCLQ